MRLNRFGHFCIVGAIGFVIDAGVLGMLMSIAGLGPYLARVFSFLAASTLTWFLNRRYTFKTSTSTMPPHRQWWRYTALMALGAAANYAVYAYFLATFPLVARFPALGVAAGSLAGLALNFSSSLLLFSTPVQVGRD